MQRAGAVAICGAILTLSSTAGAQWAITERARVQAAYATVANPPPQPRVNDPNATAAPGVTLYWFRPSATYSLDEVVQGVIHFNGGSTELDDYATLNAAYTLSPFTTLLLSASGSYSTLSQLLIFNPTQAAGAGLLPTPTTKLVSGRVSESLSHELTPFVRLTQTADVSVFTALAPAIPLDTVQANLGLGVARAWQRDSLGFDVRGGFGETLTVPPNVDQHFVTVNAGPTWRRDWTVRVTSSLNAGGSMAVSLDGGHPVFGPSGVGTLTYRGDEAVTSLTFQAGFFPTPLTGQLSQSETGTLHVGYPLSLSRQILLGASVGGGHTKVVDLVNENNDQSYNSLFSDLEVTWQFLPLFQLFGRYQFIAQLADVNTLGLNPSFLGDTFLVGVQFTSKPPGPAGGAAGGYQVQTQLPQRVDRTDAPGVSSGGAGESEGVRRSDGVEDGVQRPGEPPAPPPSDPSLNDSRGSRWIYTRPAPPAPPPPKPQWGPNGN